MPKPEQFSSSEQSKQYSEPVLTNSKLPVWRSFTNAVDMGINTFNKFPLAGKIILTPAVLYATREKDVLVRELRYLAAFGILGFFIVGHSMQARLGVESLQDLVSNFSMSNPVDWIRGAVDSSFSLINSAAVLSQLRLATRIAPPFIKNSYALSHEPLTKTPKTDSSLTNKETILQEKRSSMFNRFLKRPKGVKKPYGGYDVLYMGGVTWAGQLFFLYCR